MTSKEAVVELICEAKSANIDERRLCFLRKTIEKDLERLEIYEKFTIPNLRNLILKLYNSEELTREDHEIIFEIMSLKNKELEKWKKKI